MLSNHEQEIAHDEPTDQARNIMMVEMNRLFAKDAPPKANVTITSKDFLKVSENEPRVTVAEFLMTHPMFELMDMFEVKVGEVLQIDNTYYARVNETDSIKRSFAGRPDTAA